MNSDLTRPHDPHARVETPNLREELAKPAASEQQSVLWGIWLEDDRYREITAVSYDYTDFDTVEWYDGQGNTVFIIKRQALNYAQVQG